MISVDEWKAGGNYFVYRNQSIFYREEGEGEVILLIHGFPSSSWDWQHQWQALTKRYRVVCLDLIGFGFSSKPLGYSYSLLDQADLVQHLLNYLGIESCHILAHDYGDSVTQELLARTVDKLTTQGGSPDIKSICFLNGGLFPETHRALFSQRLLASPLGPLFAALMTSYTFKRSFSRVFGKSTQPDDATLNAYWGLIEDQKGKRIMPALIGYMAERKVQRERWVTAMQSGEVPLCLIVGMADPVSGAHMAENYRKLVPLSQVIKLEHIGHYPQVESPKIVLDSYIEFVEKQI